MHQCQMFVQKRASIPCNTKPEDLRNVLGSKESSSAHNLDDAFDISHDADTLRNKIRGLQFDLLVGRTSLFKEPR